MLSSPLLAGVVEGQIGRVRELQAAPAGQWPSTDCKQVLPNGSSVRILGVFHGPMRFQHDRKYLSEAMQETDVVILEGDRRSQSMWFRGYFEEAGDLARSLGKIVMVYEPLRTRIVKDMLISGATIFSFIYGLGRIAAARNNEDLRVSSWTQHVARLAAWTGALLFTVPSLPRLAAWALSVPALNISYATDARSVAFLAASLDAAQRKSPIKVLSVSGEGHARKVAELLSSPQGMREFEWKRNLYAWLYRPFLEMTPRGK